MTTIAAVLDDLRAAREQVASSEPGEDALDAMEVALMKSAKHCRLPKYVTFKMGRKNIVPILASSEWWEALTQDGDFNFWGPTALEAVRDHFTQALESPSDDMQ
jgi:hypothetical protein